jgi:hypothetical protein
VYDDDYVVVACCSGNSKLFKVNIGRNVDYVIDKIRSMYVG